MNNKNINSIVICALVLSIISVVVSIIPILNVISYLLGIITIILCIISFVKKYDKVLTVTSICLAILSIVISLTINIYIESVLNNNFNIENNANDSNNISVEFKDVKEENHGMYLEVKVTNNNSEIKSIVVDIEAVDKDGNRVDEGVVTVNKLKPNMSSIEEAYFLDYKDISDLDFNVISIRAYE